MPSDNPHKAATEWVLVVAKQLGIERWQLRQAGLFDFERYDQRDGESPRSIARRLIDAMAIEAKGGWTPAWPAVYSAVIAFLDEEGLGKPDQPLRKEIGDYYQTNVTNPSLEHVLDWFDRAYPAS